MKNEKDIWNRKELIKIFAEEIIFNTILESNLYNNEYRISIGKKVREVLDKYKHTTKGTHDITVSIINARYPYYNKEYIIKIYEKQSNGTRTFSRKFSENELLEGCNDKIKSVIS